MLHKITVHLNINSVLNINIILLSKVLLWTGEKGKHNPNNYKVFTLVGNINNVTEKIK